MSGKSRTLCSDSLSCCKNDVMTLPMTVTQQSNSRGIFNKTKHVMMSAGYKGQTLIDGQLLLLFLVPLDPMKIVTLCKKGNNVELLMQYFCLN